MRKLQVVAAVVCGLVLAGGGVRAAEFEQQTLFRAGEGGYVSCRIPAVVATAKGTVLAFCEGRVNSGGDSGEIRLLVRRSTDGGRTFGPQQVVWSDGPNTCGNPCPVVDASTGVVWLLMTHNPGEDHEKQINAGTATGTRTVWVTSSGDDGVTWAPPREITADVKRPEWGWYATGPGVGIQLEHGPHKGRLIIPCDYAARRGSPGGGNSHVIYSDDHGATWKIGGEPPEHRFNESQIVELEEGSVMLNMRNIRVSKDQPTTRGVAVSRDGGETFGPAHGDPALPEPVCQGSILRFAWKAERPGLILFSNPASTEKRERLMVRLSTDDGRTWPASRVVWPGPTAYSCLVKLPDGTVGLLYEAGEKKSYERIDFARFDLAWVEGKN